jgi:hypothetical protein
MKLSGMQIVYVVVGALAYFLVLFFVDKSLPDKLRAAFRYFATALTAGILFFVLQEREQNHERAVCISKAAIAITAAAAVFYEAHRKAQQRPIAERWKKLVGVGLAVAAISAYFNGFNFGYPKYYHRWDQYHYYMGAKYFPELGYKNLYKCAVVAQDELGVVTYHNDRPFNANAPARPMQVDMRAEMRDPDKKVRDLPGEDLLIPVGEILEHGHECRNRFTPERWEEYKRDVAFFRITSGKGYWTDMQKDHGFNPPPVWTIAGKFFADLSPTSVLYNQFLATLDLLYLAGMFIVLWWGFGWRVFCVGAIFWGCQSSAPFYWTGGAFLRQDWLFYTVLSVACIRKRCFKMAGASLVYSGLLRVFPGLVVVGTLVPVVIHAIKHRRMHPDHKKMLVGGCIAAAVLLPLSVWFTYSEPNDYRTYKSPVAQVAYKLIYPYKIFYQHTIQTHDRTPLTNHMGLQVIVAHKFFDFQKPGIRNADEREKWKSGLGPNARRLLGWMAPVKLPVKLSVGKESGQMQYTRNNELMDPFETWKKMRNERYDKYKAVAWGITGLTLAFFVLAMRRTKSLWIAQCLGQVFVILMSQLTCYYYSFMILGAPLSKARRQIELGLFGLAAITQIIWLNSFWNDNRYTLLTIVSLVFCWMMIGFFFRNPLKKADEADAVDDADDRQAAAA